MKKIFYILITLTVCMALILPAAAVESDGGSVAPDEYLTGTEAETEAVTVTEITEAGDTGEESAANSEEVLNTVSEDAGSDEVETEDLAAIIGNADSRLEAIVGIAEAMGISLDEAEALLNKIVVLGDEHFGENDFWLDIKESILSNPETWTIVALVVLMLVALAVFLIRGQIKNTSAQATTKANIIDIKKNEAEIAGKVSSANVKLSQIEHEHEDIKLEMDEIRETAANMLKIVEENKTEVDKICEMAALMLSEVGSLKSNSDAALSVNKEQALQTVQLLNIAMGRQLPRVSESTRKVWYEDAVTKIKEAAGVAGEAGSAGEQ